MPAATNQFSHAGVAHTLLSGVCFQRLIAVSVSVKAKFAIFLRRHTNIRFALRVFRHAVSLGACFQSKV